jgi:SAM-dependent methyltransferase
MTITTSSTFDVVGNNHPWYGRHRLRRRRTGVVFGHCFGKVVVCLSLLVATIVSNFDDITTSTTPAAAFTSSSMTTKQAFSITTATISSSSSTSRSIGIVSAFQISTSTITLIRRNGNQRCQQHHPVGHQSTTSTASVDSTVRRLQLFSSSKGFGSGNGGSASTSSSSSSSSSKKNKTNNTKKQSSTNQSKSGTINPKVLYQQVQTKYGGTTPQQIAMGTQSMIDQQIQSLPSYVQDIIPLYKLVLEWDKRLSNIDLFEATQVPTTITDQHNRNVRSLQTLLTDHNITMTEIQVMVQQITWDASADAKTMKSLMGNMPSDIESHVLRACRHVMDAITDVQTNTYNNNSNDNEEEESNTRNSRSKYRSQRIRGGGSSSTGSTTTLDCLDVGCGYGVLVPYLLKVGVQPTQILGIDLSSEMIKNAQSLYPNIQFKVTNFMDNDDDTQLLQRQQQRPTSSRTAAAVTSDDDDHDDKKMNNTKNDHYHHYYKAVIFCSSLHDLPDMRGALLKARDLVHPNGGRLIIVHPQGPKHVMEQHRSNPIMVPRGLPTRQELNDWLCTNDDDGNNDNDGDTIGDHRMELIVEPTTARSTNQEARDGYLAVLRKM